MIKAVVDANVLISAVIAPLGPSRRIFDAWREGRFTLVNSPGIIEEVSRKLAHPRISLRYGVSDEDRAAVLRLLQAEAEITPGSSEISPGTRDPGDDKVVAAAIETQADYVVTGDKDLLALEQHSGVRIVRPAMFVSLLRQAD